MQGVNDNFRMLLLLVEATKRAWYKSLLRPRINVSIWRSWPRDVSTEEPDGRNLHVRIWRAPR